MVAELAPDPDILLSGRLQQRVRFAGDLNGYSAHWRERFGKPHEFARLGLAHDLSALLVPAPPDDPSMRIVFEGA